MPPVPPTAMPTLMVGSSGIDNAEKASAVDAPPTPPPPPILCNSMPMASCPVVTTSPKDEAVEAPFTPLISPPWPAWPPSPPTPSATFNPTPPTTLCAAPPLPPPEPILWATTPWACCPEVVMVLVWSDPESLNPLNSSVPPSPPTPPLPPIEIESGVPIEYELEWPPLPPPPPTDCSTTPCA